MTISKGSCACKVICKESTTSNKTTTKTRKTKKASKENSNIICELQKGFSMLEALITLSIITIIAASSLPSMNLLFSKFQVESSLEDLRKSIASSRHLAISSGHIVTLCPAEGKQCGKQWDSGYLIFVDHNNNAIVDDEETPYQINPISTSMQISWRASGGASYLKFSPTGIARQFGRFHICKKDADLTSARSLVINRQGRVRLYQDRDRDGIVEDIDGRQPECRRS